MILLDVAIIIEFLVFLKIIDNLNPYNFILSFAKSIPSNNHQLKEHLLVFDAVGNLLYQNKFADTKSDQIILLKVFN